MMFSWAEYVPAKCGRETHEKKIRIYDLENNGGDLNMLGTHSSSNIHFYSPWSRSDSI
jgi:hypothetical protein